MPDSREWTAARDEYTYQLVQSITPDILDIFDKIYEKAKSNTEEDKSNYTLVNFQLELQKIPHWNNISVERECKKIINGYPSLMDHVAAVFVSNIQILSCVRLDTDNKKDIHIKIPTRDTFIHKVLIQCAENIYQDPLLFWHNISYGEKRENYRKKQELIGESIQEAIREMLPIQDILKEYLSETGKKNTKKEELDDASVASKESEDIESDSSGPDVKDPFYNDSDDEDASKHISVKRSQHDEPEPRKEDSEPRGLPEGVNNFGKTDEHREYNRPPTSQDPVAQHSSQASPSYRPVEPVEPVQPVQTEIHSNVLQDEVEDSPHSSIGAEKSKWMGEDSDSDSDNQLED